MTRTEEKGTRLVAANYGLAVLAGAVLVFSIQPLAGKFLLPSFGGGASVWTTCMFFFQTMLLAGYAYAYGLSTWLLPRRQAVVHAALLAVSALFLPLAISVGGPAGNPSAAIWTALLTSIGFPFAMLAATAPLLQRWFSMTVPARAPWRLYALSNLGALLALISYPLLVEPNLSLGQQETTWSAAYAVFLLPSFLACRALWRRGGNPDARRELDPAGEGVRSDRVRHRADAALGVVLSACGVVLLLAVTNQITTNVAPIPFLWVLPLTVYLLTYVVAFGGPRGYDRPVWGSLFVVSACCLAILDFFGGSFPIIAAVCTWLLALFCSCMVCHGELYRLRPAPRQLGAYYLQIALGGALGGAFVSLAAPLLFVRYWETLAGAYLLYLLFGFIVLREMRARHALPAGANLPAAAARIETWGRRLFTAGWAAGLFLFPAVVVLLAGLLPAYDVAGTRNFYGILNVRDVTGDGPPRRVLVDGTTIHGFQLRDPAGSRQPTSYYGRNTGIGMLMERIAADDERFRAGVVGLGAGTLAAYGREGDLFRFYELNPAVVEVARRHFSFLRDSAAAVDVVIGDGRVSLQNELRWSGSRQYDLLVIDAFSSDAIPVHLLTREAQRLYWSHLADGGMLAFHVTNNYLDLAPVVAAVGAEAGKRALLLTTPSEHALSAVAEWVVLTDAGDPFAAAVPTGVTATLLEPDPRNVWSDDFSRLLRSVRRR